MGYCCCCFLTSGVRKHVTHILESIKLPIFKADSLLPVTINKEMLRTDNFDIHGTRKWCR
jgi:hypothetical protein